MLWLQFHSGPSPLHGLAVHYRDKRSSPGLAFIADQTPHAAKKHCPTGVCLPRFAHPVDQSRPSVRRDGRLDSRQLLRVVDATVITCCLVSALFLPSS